MAYKLLLADDEVEIRNGIIQTIDWEGNGFHLVGAAANGQEAWEMAEKLRPDVVMTDIKMPFLSGLELGEKLFVHMPLTKLVLFSGFDDFEYAKQAIKINATEYILKPIDARELVALLQKIKTQLDKEKDERRNIETLRKNYIESLPILRQQFFCSLLEGKMQEGQIERLSKQYSVAFSGDCYTVAVIAGDTRECSSNSFLNQPELIPHSMLQLIQENLSRFYFIRSFIYNGNLVVLAMLDHKQDILRFVDVLNRVCRSVGEALELSVSAGVGSPCDRLSGLRYAYEGAMNALGYRILMGYRVIYIEDVEPDISKELEFDEQTHRALLNAIKLEGEDAIQMVVGRMLEGFRHARLPMHQYQIYMTEFLSAILKVVRGYKLDREQVFGSEFKGYLEIQAFESLEELERWILGVCIRTSQLIRRERLDSAKLLAERAKEFVQENYMNADLSVEMLCSHLHVSPAYFSTIFKKETGSNFITYLTNVRMEEAVRLLQTTDDKTYMISVKVGYTEPNYFSYVFKKHFGLSPSRYRTQGLKGASE